MPESVDIIQRSIGKKSWGDARFGAVFSMLGVPPPKDCFLGVTTMLRCGTKQADSYPHTGWFSVKPWSSLEKVLIWVSKASNDWRTSLNIKAQWFNTCSLCQLTDVILWLVKQVQTWMCNQQLSWMKHLLWQRAIVHSIHFDMSY